MNEREIYEFQADQTRRANDYRIEVVVAHGGKPFLCSCPTFSDTIVEWYHTSNGYCKYCGGWNFEVYRNECGEDALFEQIDRLAYHARIKMKEIVGPRRDDWPEVIGA